MADLPDWQIEQLRVQHRRALAGTASQSALIRKGYSVRDPATLRPRLLTEDEIALITDNRALVLRFDYEHAFLETYPDAVISHDHDWLVSRVCQVWYPLTEVALRAYLRASENATIARALHGGKRL